MGRRVAALPAGCFGLWALFGSSEEDATGPSDRCYTRTAGREAYRAHIYWGIIASGRYPNGPPVRIGFSRVREDGTVVLMLGCI